MGEGTVFSLFVSSHLDGGYPIPGLGGGTPSQVWMGGYPIPGLDGGVPHPKSGGTPGYPTPVRCGWWRRYLGYPQPGLDGGGYPGVPPSWLDGVPPPTMTGWGTPHHDWMGTPPPWLDGVPLPHHDWLGYPLPKTEWGTSPPPLPLDRAA